MGGSAQDQSPRFCSLSGAWQSGAARAAVRSHPPQQHHSAVVLRFGWSRSASDSQKGGP